MRRAFTVASVFTGAVTCAAAFTPTATTATAGETHAIVQECGGATTSMVLYWTPSEHHGPTCIGGHGAPYTVSLGRGDTLFTGYCTGDDSGTLYINQNKTPFEAGENVSFPGSPPAISKVHIQKRHGRYTCAG